MYRMLCRPNHHRADITGLVPAYVLKAEELLRRPLKKGELVHHMDFNKLNDDASNLLFPITRREHQQLPEYQARYILSKGLYAEFLTWMEQEKKNDEANIAVIELERKLVRAQNERERLLKKGETHNGK